MSNRIIVLDTETTGLDPKYDKIIEVGLVIMDGFEVVDQFQEYYNPGRSIHPNATKVHGLTEEFLSVFGTFNGKKIAELLEGAVLVIHNAQFDVRFLNKEFEVLNMPPISNAVIDTLDIAQKTFPGAPASLDALCSRFKIPNNHRHYHGALLDALLLVKVYSHLRNHGVTKIEFTENTSQNTVRLSNAIIDVSDSEEENYIKMINDLQ